ncbi:hypothetical protein ACFRAQ_05635 [Nocardia sp. NPDC056611]|uniref:hypothetical protein n=1 Tax=Nocardia sp. NPDC056611 TaxID=3345877 RepID=UPI00366E2900
MRSYKFQKRAQLTPLPDVQHGERGDRAEDLLVELCAPRLPHGGRRVLPPVRVPAADGLGARPGTPLGFLETV